MERNTVALKRTEFSSVAAGKIGAQALLALAQIPGVEDLRIENETDEKVDLSYVWTGQETFWTTQEHLAQFGLERIF